MSATQVTLSFGKRLVGLMLMLLIAVAARGLEGLGGVPGSFEKTAPEAVSDLVAMQERFEAIAERATRCTVGIQVESPRVSAYGSGVIVSSDGYVLTAAHVAGRPGQRLVLMLPDGRTVQGKTLGIHTEVDGAVVKITDEGEWPFAEIVPADDWPTPGDWCVATGHPGGFDKQRTPPVRIGRVIDVNGYVLRTDCTITQGDSGGPLFDAEGRVIGIHSRIAEQSTVNLHGPALAVWEQWEKLVAGEIYPPVPESEFLDQFDMNDDGRVGMAELPDGLHRRVFERLAEKLDLEADREYTIGELKDLLGWKTLPPRIQIQPYRLGGRSGQSLNRNRFVRGRAIRRAFNPLLENLGGSTVEVLRDGKRVALGTVAHADGWILTKASPLDEAPVTIKTNDAKSYPARLVRKNVDFDVALLKVDGVALKPVVWHSAEHLKPGSWLVTPDRNGEAATVGVVSVAEREIRRSPVALGVAIEDSDAGAKVIQVFPRSGAADAGLQIEDVIRKIVDQPVKTLVEVKAAVENRHVGDVVRMEILRGSETLELKVTLRRRDEIFFGRGQDPLSGPLNRRRDGFPIAIQHDSVLLPSDCGGPVVDVHGRVVGINVARADRVVSFAIPSHALEDLFEEIASPPAADEPDEEPARQP